MTINNFLIIAAVSTIVITLALVPLIFQLRRTIKKAEIMIDNVDHQLKPLLSTLNQTAEELNTLSGSINRKLDDADAVIKILRLSGESLLLTSNLFRKTVAPVIMQVGGIGSGLKAFLNFLSLTGHKSSKEGK